MEGELCLTLLKAALKQSYKRSQQRAERDRLEFGEIIQSAAAQSMTELKEGVGEIRSTASQSVSNIAQTIAQTSSEAETTESSEASSFSTVFHSIQNWFVNQTKSRLLNLDAKLTSRWGDASSTQARDRYETVKQRLGLFRIWYNNSKANAEAVGMTPVQQKQAEIELKIADQGAFVARKEQQIRQQAKQFLSAALSQR